MSDFTVKTFREVGVRTPEERQIMLESWPEFMRQDPIGNAYFDRLRTDFGDFQFMLYDGDTLAVVCHSIPVRWDLNEHYLPNRGWDWALETGFELLERGETPITLCAIGIQVARAYQGKGVSQQAVRAMKQIAVQHGFNALIAPVRPSLKHRYPLTPMARYVEWTQADGTPFDPWLRTHWRLGAKIVKVAQQSMIIPGSVAEWESWAEMKFPDSGDYVVPLALNPVNVEVERDLVTYIEPNVWMHHPIQQAGA